MSSLTETAIATRKLVNLTIIGLILIIAGRIFWIIFINWWTATHPPPPPPPNMAFGKLEPLKFPNLGKEIELSYKLETITGRFPESSPSAKVYFMPVISANLLSLDRASEKAKSMGFKNEPLALSESDYLWSDPENPLRTLNINIVTGNLTLSYDYRQDSYLLKEKNLPDKDKSVEEGRTILNNFDLAKEDIDMENPVISYLKIQGGMLTKVNALNEADFVKVGYNRYPIDEMQINTPTTEKFIASIIFSGSNDSVKRIIELNYNYQIIDYQNFATYPLKKPEEAFEALKAGEAQIANPGDENKEKVIRNIYLSYYDSLSLQTYLQPVFVFEGDHNFKAYTAAIKDEWIYGK